ncbi:MAG TPA: type I methionyl aminopeptidase [Bacteroidales bacterium]|nr:type I methionyl aminopeptidase [Bacteroidales bacterium]
MIQYKTDQEIELIRESSLLVSKTLAEVARHIKPGITTQHLDKVAEEFIRDHGATPGFKGYNGFPFALCVSPNEVVVHGFPSKKELKEGEILSIDCGVLKNGFYGDSAFTFAIGEVSDALKRLLKVTFHCLTLGIEKAVEGNSLGDISGAIQSFAEREGFSVVRELVGHGIGRNLHEAPEVPNFGKMGQGLKLKEGLVVAIEPMINMGQRYVKQDSDGWTIRTKDRKPSAHYEHTVAIKKGRSEVLSTFSYIEEALKGNRNSSIVVR